MENRGKCMGCSFVLFSWLAYKSRNFPPTNFFTHAYIQRFSVRSTNLEPQKLLQSDILSVTKICTPEYDPIYGIIQGLYIPYLPEYKSQFQH